MTYLWRFFKAHKFGMAVFLIILLAFVLRFYNYENRWGLAYDQGRDILVAREGLKSFSLPLIGPFASAGQFVYGPQWYWILMGLVAIYPYSVITPWIIQTLLYVVVVGLMIIIGKDIHSKNFGLVLGALTAVSTAQISQATNLTSPSMVGIFAFISLYFLTRYIKTSSIKNAFWLSFVAATSVNIHFQAIGLLAFIPVSFLLDKKRNLKKILYMGLGILIPFIPLIFFDLTNNFFESKNWIEYIVHGQYAIYVPNRWLTYAGEYWPSSWTKIIGGEAFVGYIIPALFAIFLAISAIGRKLSRPMVALILGFCSIFLMLRYYRGERIDSNLAFLHPFVLIFTGWVIMRILKLNRAVGLILFLVIIVFALRADLSQIKSGENFTAIQAREWTNVLTKKNPNKKFAVYDYHYKDINKSLPLVLFLESKNRISDKGEKIGFYVSTSETDFTYPVIFGKQGEYQILNLESTSSAHLEKEGWVFINTSQVYKSTVEWYKKDKL